MDIDLASVTTTEQITQFAFYSAISVFIMVVLLTFQVVILRFHNMSSRKRRYHLLKKWRPILTNILLGGEAGEIFLPRKEVKVFIEEWNRMFGTVRGENLQYLINLANHLRLDLFARKMLKSRSMHNRLLAIITLGHMKEYSVWDDFKELVLHPHPIISITAARAMMWIDAKNAPDIVIPLINERTDWTWSNVAYVLKQAQPIDVCEKLSDLVSNAPIEKQPGLIRYLETSQCLQLTDVILNLLYGTKDDRVASVCLHTIRDPRALPIIRTYLTHERWHVRMHAATALGFLGDKSDVEKLLRLTEDSNWWVRYRAAQAIIKLPDQNIESLQALISSQQDKYSRDIFSQVIAEVETQ